MQLDPGQPVDTKSSSAQVVLYVYRQGIFEFKFIGLSSSMGSKEGWGAIKSG